MTLTLSSELPRQTATDQKSDERYAQLGAALTQHSDPSGNVPQKTSDEPTALAAFCAVADVETGLTLGGGSYGGTHCVWGEGGLGRTEG